MTISYTLPSHWLRIWFVLLSVLMSGTGVLTTAAVANTAFIEDGLERFGDDDIKGALIQFENAVRENPDDMRARLLLCEALIKVERYSRAEIMLNIVTKKAPSARASFRRAEAIYRRGRVQDAEQALRSDAEILASDTDWRDAVDAFENLIAAENASGEKDPKTAIRRAKKVIDSNDDHFTNDARMILARSWFRLGEFRRAQIAVDFVPERASIRFLAKLLSGRIALNLGDTRTAATIGEELVSEFEGNPEVHSFVVETLIRLGEYEEAREHAKKITPISSTDRRADFLKFLSYVAEGDLENASNISLGAGAWLQGFRHGSLLLAQVKFQTGRFQEAERVLRTHTLRYPRDFDARALLIRAALAQDDHDYAQKLIGESLLMNRNSVPVLFAKVEKLLLDKEYSAAAELSAEALKIRRRSAGDTGDEGVTENLSKFAIATVGVSEAMRLGRTREAAEVARLLIKDEPDNPLAHNLLAGVHVNLNELDLAQQSLDRALELDPNLTAALINYATLETRRGKKDALRTRLGTAIENGTRDSAIFIALVDQLERDGDLPEALALARQGFALHPKSSDLGLRLAQFHAELGNTGASLAIAEQFANSTDIDLVADGAGIYLRLEAYDKAIGVLKWLRNRGRGSDSADDVLLTLYLAEKKYGEAYTLIEQMRVNQPEDPDLLHLLITCSIELGRLADAAQVVSQAAAIDQALGVFLKARVLVAQGNRAGATEILIEEMSARPSGYIARQRYLLAKGTNAPEGEIETAFAILKQWGDDNPEDVDTLRLLGYIYLDDKNYGAADKALTAVLSGAETDAELLNNLAWARYESGRPGGANFAARAYAIEPGNVDYIDSFGYLLAKEGKRDRGIELLREAVSQSGRRADIVARLAEIEGGR